MFCLFVYLFLLSWIIHTCDSSTKDKRKINYTSIFSSWQVFVQVGWFNHTKLLSFRKILYGEPLCLETAFPTHGGDICFAVPRMYSNTVVKNIAYQGKDWIRTKKLWWTKPWLGFVVLGCARKFGSMLSNWVINYNLLINGISRWWFESFFNFHHYFGEDDFLFDSYFSKGLVQPPSRKLWWKNHGSAMLSKQKFGGIYGYLPFQVCQSLLGNTWRMGSQDLDLWLITMVSCKSSK